MTKRAIAWTAVLAVLLPIPLEAQQDPALIGEGAQVYAANCTRCHSARSGTERSDAEWVPIIAHMRARANFTRRQADAALAFLQATNLPEGVAPAGTAGASLTPASAVMPLELRTVLALWGAARARRESGSTTATESPKPSGRGG